MLNISSISIFLILLIGFVYGCRQKNEAFEYYRFPDSENKERVITKMILDEKVYFVNYFYDKKEVPPAYISPTAGMDNYFYCYLYCEGSKCYLLTNYGKWEVVGNPEDFYLKEVKDNVDFNNFTAQKEKFNYQVSSGSVIN